MLASAIGTNGLLALIILCSLMGLASFGTGMLPLTVSLSQDRVRLVSTVGMGMLMGTSLIVIIPEGVQTIYSTPFKSNTLRPVPGLPHPNPITPPTNKDDTGLKERMVEKARRYAERKAEDISEESDYDIGLKEIPISTAAKPSFDPDSHKYIGISLIFGFIFMYLIDRIPPLFFSSGAHSHHNSVDVSELRTYSVSSNGSPTTRTASDNISPQSASSLTTGIVIHAIADGIALGASVASSSATLEVVVFVALMLHKVPAAFGMAAVLLRTGISKKQVKQHLLVFSAAAPIGALVTWIAIMMIGYTDGGVGLQWWTGVILVFSGGTFLYVAIHVMQDLDESAKQDSNGQMHMSVAVRDIIATVIGMAIPLVTLLADE
ncbi:Zinc/iron permease [Dipodascopsis uninucleata]